LTSQLLTLYITPVIYLSLERIRQGGFKAIVRSRTIPSPSAQPAE
jgi:hypothetical protein